MSDVVAVVLAMLISNLSSDKIAHVHMYATTILCVIFWIKSNIKISKFLTISLNKFVKKLDLKIFTMILIMYYKY